MDQGGPLEGAPIVIADPMDLTIIDKVCTESTWPDDNIVSSSTFCDNPKKLNSKFYFLTVECIEDQTKDFGRMYSSFEQVSFSSRADSPLSDFEHRVSPHDPNMSSAARYSPTPVALPSSPFNNPEVVLPEPSSPLISTSESTTKMTNGYSTQIADQSSTASLPQSENSEDFTDSTSDDLVSSVGNELMLIQAGSSTELEASSDQLMLGEISGSELTLAKDFLIQEDQINVINSMKLHSNLGSEITSIPEAILNSIIDQGRDGETPAIKNCRKISKVEKILDSSGKNTSWIKNEVYEKNSLWHEDCDSTCVDVSDCTVHGVCTIADQPVPSRAVATLPGLYLSIDKLPSSNSVTGSGEFGVFAKRNIRRRTQFGPIEGVLRSYDGSQIDGLPLLIETGKKNEFLQIDISNENSSNWMRFVRPAKNFEEQNLVICQQNDGIVFLTTRNIMPKEELKAGPSHDYGKRRNLPVLDSEHGNSSEDSNLNSNDKTNLKNGDLEIIDELIQKKQINGNCQNNLTRSQIKRKASCASFQKYLDIDEDEDSDLSVKVFKKNFKSSFEQGKFTKLREKEKENSLNLNSELMKPEITQSDQANSSVESDDIISSIIHKCTTCSKLFPTKLKLQQHCLTHDIKDNSLSCYICLKTFLNNSSLTRHLKTHQKDKKALECPICSEAFGMILTLKDYPETHLNQDETFTCPHCPKTFNSYALARKHARAHHFDRKHECQFCLKCFPAADKLRMHLLKHSDHREFQCAHCGKQFKRKDKLKDHVTRVHYTQKTCKDQLPSNNRAKKTIPKEKTNPVDCDRFVYKCRRCQVGFKRRGMLVNHLAKRHPDVSPETVPELSLPILRQTRDYYCQYCEKVYKSSSKRKAHIMKNHPGAALPPSNRNKEFDIPGVPNPTFSQAAGSIKTVPQGCQWCHKQYASKAKLLQHQRKKHSSLMEPADQIPRPRCRPPQNQNQPPTSSITGIEKTHNKSDTSELCDESKDFKFIEPHFLHIKNTGGESLSGNNGFELLNPQFARVRDIR